MHQAARSGDVQAVRLKLQNPDVLMNIDELDGNGMSALHYAARFNHHEIVVMLVRDGKASQSELWKASKITRSNTLCNTPKLQLLFA